ncbi:MAG: helix-turn-helix domain-containing protein [Nitrospirota bacterium]|nr:helix-turn-helix domain-containing protein [Nitrospirota bacterium]
MDTLLSLAQVSDRLSCSREMLKKWIRLGRIHIVKIGRLTRIRQSDVEAWVRLGLQHKEKNAA